MAVAADAKIAKDQHEIRCLNPRCRRLLFRGVVLYAEVKCPRCKRISTFVAVTEN